MVPHRKSLFKAKFKRVAFFLPIFAHADRVTELLSPRGSLPLPPLLRMATLNLFSCNFFMTEMVCPPR